MLREQIPSRDMAELMAYAEAPYREMAAFAIGKQMPHVAQAALKMLTQPVLKQEAII